MTSTVSDAPSSPGMLHPFWDSDIVARTQAFAAYARPRTGPVAPGRSIDDMPPEALEMMASIIGWTIHSTNNNDALSRAPSACAQSRH